MFSRKRGLKNQRYEFGTSDIDFEELREETFCHLLDSIDRGILTERTVNQLNINNVKILLHTSNLNQLNYDFDKNFP